MELSLNLAWLAISVGLGAVFLVSRSRNEALRQKCTYRRATACVAYLLLVAFLLPAISMTDDMMAMTAPTDGEQVVRRYEAATASHLPVVLRVAGLFHVAGTASVPALVTVGIVTLPTIEMAPFSSSKSESSRAPPAAA